MNMHDAHLLSKALMWLAGDHPRGRGSLIDCEAEGVVSLLWRRSGWERRQIAHLVHSLAIVKHFASQIDMGLAVRNSHHVADPVFFNSCVSQDANALDNLVIG